MTSIEQALRREGRRDDSVPSTSADIERKVLGHVGFGAVVQALSKQVARIELAGEPERRFNNTLRGLKRLPLRVVPA